MSRNLFFLVSFLFSLYFVVFSIIVIRVPVPLELIGIILALFSLYLGGDSFLDNAREFGNRHKISPKSIGAYLLSLGAVIDEFSVIFVASFHRYGEISFGTLQGSNIITMMVFLAVLPLVFAGSYRKFMRDGIILLVASALLEVLSLFFEVVPWYIGIFMALLFLVYIYTGRGEAPPIEEEYVHMEYSPVSMLVALIILGLASEAIVNYTNGISIDFNVSPFISGFIVTGVAGSLPEIIMFYLGIKKQERDITLGIVAGSTMYKATLIMGITMLFGIVNLRAGEWSIYLMILLSVIFLIFTLIKMKKAMMAIPVVATVIFAMVYLFF
ncbi:MAG: hypothetical protein M1507_03770 [Candidatus Thermoplasmatota archaeon]|nr:hypothetical protein [Candidatus Thermoplasmatota archaeon]